MLHLQKDIDPKKLNLKDSIDEFFSPKELEAMGDYERNHLKAVRQNYEMMKFMGELF